MIVFSDSNADTGRRFNAPASFDFDDIGPFPFKRLFDGSESNVSASVRDALAQILGEKPGFYWLHAGGPERFCVQDERDSLCLSYQTIAENLCVPRRR